MLANFDLTWKNACLEMLNYVRCFNLLTDEDTLSLISTMYHYSSPNARQAPLSRNVARL